MRDTTDIQQISQGLAAAVEAAGASVVRVEGRHRRPSSGIVWSADGVVATADHKIDREEGIRVGLADGRAVPATLVGRDPRTDVAVLRAEATGLAPIEWAPGDEAKVGHLVLALSRPGETVRASLGIVCASAGEWRTHAGGKIDRWLETDVLHQPGFTGGLLADAAGRGLGMDDAGLRRGRGLAVPAATLKRVVESILAHGGVRRGYLGIAVQPARLPESAAAAHGAHGSETALLVVAVQPGSPAEQGGILLGDVLLAVDGKPAADPGVLQSILDEDRVGAEVVFSVLRGGEAREARVTVGAR